MNVESAIKNRGYELRWRLSMKGRKTVTEKPADAEDILHTLANVLEEHVQAQSWKKCLALTWLVLVRKAGHRHSGFAHKTMMAAPEWAELPRLAEQVSDAAGEQLIREILANAPCMLLSVFDELVLNGFKDYGADASTLEAPIIYSSGVETLNLDPGDLHALGLNADHVTIYAVEVRGAIARLPTGYQRTHPYHYTPHCWILPALLGRAEGDFTVSIEPAPSLHPDLHSISERNPRLLRVYLAEFISAPAYEAEWVNSSGGKAWIAKDIQNSGLIIDEAIEHLTRARSNFADIVIFPELSFTKAIRERIAGWLRINNLAADGAGGHLISLVVCGSSHGKDTDEKIWHNESRTLDSRGNEVIGLRQKKLTYVDLIIDGQKIFEGNTPSNVVRAVSSPLGLMATVICLDLAQSQVSTAVPLRWLPLSFLWVPSLSGTVNPHIKQSEQLLTHLPTIVACANQGPVYFDGNDKASQFPAGLSFLSVWHDNKPTTPAPIDPKPGAGITAWKLLEVPFGSVQKA